ncbi:hypothetical protein Tco_0832519 [Tanacetum coccineum]
MFAQHHKQFSFGGEEDKLDDEEKDDKERDAKDEGDDHISDIQDTNDEDDEIKSDEDDIYKYKIPKADDEKTLEVKDDAKKTKLPPTSSSLSFLTPVQETSSATPVTTLPPRSISTTPPVPQQTTTLIPTPPITTDAPIITTVVYKSDVLSVVQVRVARLEKDVSKLKKIDLSIEAFAALKTQVPSVVDHYLGSKVGDVFQKDLKKHTTDIIQKYSLQQTPDTKKDENAIDKSPAKVGYDKDALKGIKNWGKRHKLWHRSQLNKFSKHNVYSSKKILGVKSVSVKKLHGYGHLEEIVVKRVDRQLYKFKEGDFVNLHLNDIEDMLLLAVQHKLFHLTDRDIVDFIVALRMFTRSLVIKKQTFPEIEFKELYTPSHKPPWVIYEDLVKQKRVIRADELYKFSDGMLKKVRDELHHKVLDFDLGYNKEMSRRKWTATDKKRSELMVELIDKHMRERRIIQNRERLVGARELKMDYKLMTCTV